MSKEEWEDPAAQEPGATTNAESPWTLERKFQKSISGFP